MLLMLVPGSKTTASFSRLLGHNNRFEGAFAMFVGYKTNLNFW